VDIKMFNNKLLKYPITDDEMKYYDDVWTFLELFKVNYIFVSDYRKNVIKSIISKYTAEEFLKYEDLLNKLFWNLRFIVAGIYLSNNNVDLLSRWILTTDDISESLLLCEWIQIKGSIDDIIKDNHIIRNERYSHYRSFINKLVIVDRIRDRIWLKTMEGSSDIFAKNNFNLLTITILFNRDLYEDFMRDPFNRINREIPLSSYYFQHDYPFPNMNYCTYLFCDKDERLNRIKKMYYSPNMDKRYWYKIIY